MADEDPGAEGARSPGRSLRDRFHRDERRAERFRAERAARDEDDDRTVMLADRDRDDDGVDDRVDPDGGRGRLTDDDIEVITHGEDLGIYRAHRRYGGLDTGAAIGGVLAAVGMTALLAGLAGGIGTVGYQLDVERDSERLSTGGFVAGLVVVLLSFLVGGWVAGRVARYDGGRNGLLAAALFVVLSAVLAGLGAWLGDEYDVFANIQVPQWFSDLGNATAVLSGLLAIVVVLAAGWLGGMIGGRYHTKADAYLAEYANTTETGTVRSRGGRRLGGRRAVGHA